MKDFWYDIITMCVMAGAVGAFIALVPL